MIGFSLSPNFSCTQSRSRKREARKASVAPMVEAKETITVPHRSPNTAPPASVITVAPGSESPVTTT
ncbi:hypothetical protein D3C83_104880 [compost metagenome]